MGRKLTEGQWNIQWINLYRWRRKYKVYEFRKGIIDYENDEAPHWKEDSLYIEDDFIRELQLDSLFSETLEDYDCTGETVVTPLQWEKITARAAEAGGKWQEVIEELSPWAEETFANFDCFTVIGV